MKIKNKVKLVLIEVKYLLKLNLWFNLKDNYVIY
jgi:hypothetical protein